MKNLFVSLIAITTFIFSAQAQDNTSGKSENSIEQKKEWKKEHGRFDHQQMAEKLNFTEEQKQQMKSINSDFKNQMEELKKNGNVTGDKLKEKRHTLSKERMEKVQALLTPEQKAQMQEFRKEGKNGKGKFGGEKRMEKMKSTLSLSDEQISKIKAQKEEFASKAEAIKNNQSLTSDQRNEQLKSLREERRNSFKSFLTPEQLKKLEEMKHDKPVKTS